MGMETIKVAREALGLSIALEQSHARMPRANGARPQEPMRSKASLPRQQHEQLATWLKSSMPPAVRWKGRP
jgi:hypothetical protein